MAINITIAIIAMMNKILTMFVSAITVIKSYNYHKCYKNHIVAKISNNYKSLNKYLVKVVINNIIKIKK